MNIKDDDGEIISKKLLDSLTWISAIATALAAILTLLFPDENAKRLSFLGALILAAAVAAILVYRRRHAMRLKITEMLEPLQPSAALRGLLPFEEGDNLPGRSGDVRGLYTLIASSTFRFGVLWGESGCGKTSLLRAGLTPALRNDKYLPLYVGKPTKEPRDAIRAALRKENEELGERVDEDLKSLLRTATPKGKKAVIIFDQFEEFFLTNRTPRSRASFIRWLGEVIAEENLPIVFLIGIRSDFFAQLQNLAPQIPDPTSPQSTYQLQSFEVEEAKQIFNAAAKIDGIPFEPALIDAVVSDLEIEEFIRPAELQIVGTRLKRKNVFSLNRYEVLGRARGILSSYIVDEIKQSVNETTARLLLRLLCAEGFETKSPIDLSLEDIVRGTNGSEQAKETSVTSQSEAIQKILAQFVAARILVHTEDNKYNLVHDYLAPYVRVATEGTETNVERANRWLKHSIAEYKEDPKTRLSIGRLRWIEKYASNDVKNADRTRELIRKSKQAFYLNGARITLIALTVLLLPIYIYLANSYYLSLEEYTGDSSRIVVRSGHPQLKFLPGFDDIVIRTEFTLGDLDASAKARDDILREQVTGLWLRTSPEGYEKWGEQLAIRLSPTPQMRAWRWLNQPQRAVKLALFFLTDPDTSIGMHRVGAQLLGELALVVPEIITADVVQTLSEISFDARADSYLRLSAANSLAQIGQSNPSLAAQVVTPGLLQVICDMAGDPQLDSVLRTNATYALRPLVEVNPEAVTSKALSILTDNAVDSQASPWLRYASAFALWNMAIANPNMANRAVTSDVLSSVIGIVTDKDSDSGLRRTAMDAVGTFAQVNPQSVTSTVLQAVTTIIADSATDSDLQWSPTSALAQLAQINPQSVTEDEIRALIKFVSDDSPPDRRRYVIEALNALTEANPPTGTADVAQSMNALITALNVNSSLRYAAARVLAQLARNNPQLITPGLTQTWLNMATDSQIDSDRRDVTMYTLQLLAPVSPLVDTNAMVEYLCDVIAHSSSAELRISAASTLGSLAQVISQTVTPETIQAMSALVISLPSERVGPWGGAAYTLQQMAQVSPQSVTTRIIQSMHDVAIDPQVDSDRRRNALAVLDVLIQASPQNSTTGMIQSLLDLITNSPHIALRISAANALQTFATVNPQVVSSDDIQSLRDIVMNSSDAGLRITAANVLGIVAKTYPQAVTAEIVQAIDNLVINHNTNGNLRWSATNTLEQLAQVSPQYVTTAMLQSLSDIVVAPESSDLKIYAVNSLGILALANPQAVTARVVQALSTIVVGNYNGYYYYDDSSSKALLLLADSRTSETLATLDRFVEADVRSAGRNIGTYSLFIISVGSPSKAADIRNQMEKLRNSSLPQVRINASQTIEMLEIANLIQTVQAHPEQLTLIQSRLSELMNSSEAHLKFASEIVNNKIAQLNMK